MQSSSPLLHIPSTPISSHTRYLSLGYDHRPLNSSPLASPNPKSSPVVAAQARRRSQYKSRTPSAPVASTSRNAPNATLAAGLTSSESTQKAFLREKFRQRCLVRASKAREKAIRSRRHSGYPSSDGFDESMDDEEEEDDDDIMQDELFRRIMNSSQRRERYSYKLSFADEVGSSFDPDMEDVALWEHELAELEPSNSTPTSSQVTSKSELPAPTLADLEDEELQAYAEECARRAALEDFADIPEEELFSWSDIEDIEAPTKDTDMDIDMTN